VTVLQWVTREMTCAITKLAEAAAATSRNITTLIAQRGEKRLPFLVVIVDDWPT